MNRIFSLFFLLALILNVLPVISQDENEKPVKSQENLMQLDPVMRTGGMARSYAMGAGGFGSMGGVARYTNIIGENPFLVDPSHAAANPAWIGVYNNFAYCDIYEGGNFVANLKIGDNLTVGGLFGTHWAVATEAAMYSISHPGYSYPLDPELHFNNFGIFGSFKMKSMILGAGITYAHFGSSAKLDSGMNKYKLDTDTSGSDFGIYIGALIDFSKDMKLDFGASIQLPSLSRTFQRTYIDSVWVDSRNNSSEFSFSIITIDSRLLYKFQKNLRIIPFIKLRMLSGSSKDVVNELNTFRPLEATNLTNEYDQPSNFSFDFGVGLNYAIGKFLFVGGPSFGYYTQTIPELREKQHIYSGYPIVTRRDTVIIRSRESTGSQIIFPRWNFGAEWYAADWLVARIGYVSSIISEYTKTSYDYSYRSTVLNSEQTITAYNQYMSPGIRFGLGFRFGGFTIDGVVGSDIIRLGLSNFATSNNSTFSMLTASYGF